MKALALYNYLEENKGGTIKNGEIMEYQDGYQVATRETEELEFQSLGGLLLYLDACELDSFGAWYDAGAWWLDLSSVHIKSKKEALELAKQENQKAIYSWKTKKSIFI